MSRGGKSWGAIAIEACCECECGVSSQGELRFEVDETEADDETSDGKGREVVVGSTAPSNENPLNNSGSTSGNGDSSPLLFTPMSTTAQSNAEKSVWEKVLPIPKFGVALGYVHDRL